MTDNSSAIERYFAAWNEHDPAQRRDLIAQAWSDDASYVDPLLEGVGQQSIDAMVASVHQSYPGYTLRLAGPIDNHHNRVRFNWGMIGPDGVEPAVSAIDFGVVADDGRLEAITGFLDQVPAGLLNH